MSMNIILIGMPGAGKSTVGVVLAKTVLKNYVDTDIIIQQKEGFKLHEIIKNNGIERFLNIEEKHILTLNVTDCIIATGGSVVYSDKAMKHLKNNGIVIYLKLGYGEVEKRLLDIKTRGIAMEKGVGLKELYLERVPLYEKYADRVIDCNGKSVEEIVNELIRI